MADESEVFTSLPSEKGNCGATSVPGAVEETNLEAKAESASADVKLRPGIAPIKTE